MYELYEKMVATDARIGGIVGSLTSTVSGLDMKLHSGKGVSAAEGKLAEDYRSVVNEMLEAPGFDPHAYTKDLVSVFFMGQRVFQLQWNTVDYQRGRKFHFPKQPLIVPGQKFHQEMQQDHKNWGELKIITKANPNGIFVHEQDPARLFMVSDGAHRGRYDVSGVLRRVIGWWVTKVYAQLWWAEWVETYGQPMRVGRYPAEATSKQKQELRSFLRMVGRNKWGIFPEGVNVQLIESNTQGNVTTFRDLITMASNEIAVAIVGQTGITTDSAQGSRAKLETLFEIRQEIVKQVGRVVTTGYDRLIEAVLTVNYGPDYIKRLAPKVVLTMERPGSLKDLVELFVQLGKLGYPISIEQLSEQLGVPMAEAGSLVMYRGQIIEMPEKIADLQKIEVKENVKSDSNSSEESVPEGEEAPGDAGDGSGDGEEDQGEDA